MREFTNTYISKYLVEFPDEVGHPEWRTTESKQIDTKADVVWARGYFLYESGQAHQFPALVEMNESLRQHKHFIEVLKSFVQNGHSVVIIKELSTTVPLTDTEVTELLSENADESQNPSILQIIHESVNIERDLNQKSYIEEAKDAAVGAAHLYRQAHLELQKTNLSKKRTTELKAIKLQAALTLRSILLKFNNLTKASTILELFSLQPDWDRQPKPVVLSEALLFTALLEAAQHVDAHREKALVTPPNYFVAVVGRNNSGKGFVSAYLREKYGFTAEPLSDRVKEYATALGNSAPFNRQTLIDTGLRVKALFGEAVLIHTAIAQLFAEGKENRLLFDGLRNEGEALGLLELQKPNLPVVCLSVVADADPENDIEIRFQRALLRNGPKDPKEDTEEERAKFRRLDEQESGGIEAARKHATHLVENKDGEQEETLKQIDQIMAELGVTPIS